MLERLACGELPAKHHLASFGPEGRLRYEACLTRDGFEGPYTISYHRERPQAYSAVGSAIASPLAARAEVDARALTRRHYRTQALEDRELHDRLLLGQHPRSALRSVPLLFSADVVLGVARPADADATYHINAGADELWFVLSGQGLIRSLLGDLQFVAGDYVFLPKGLLYRLVPSSPADAGSASLALLTLEFPGGAGIPRRFRNAAGQLRMDAPYCHRDFKRPTFRGPLDEGIREVWIKDAELSRRAVYPHSPLDVVGWDGSLYPWAFPILKFQPRVSSVHLPPTWHGTFEAKGALICSFVPRPLDFHPQAVPCPYTHTSADVDEVLFYVEGQFASRLGVERGSLTHHPAGVAHGPHPGRYEESLGVRQTEEVAVMLDCKARLQCTRAALDIEATDYESSFGGASPE